MILRCFFLFSYIQVPRKKSKEVSIVGKSRNENIEETDLRDAWEKIFEEKHFFENRRLLPSRQK